jgi:SNF2 family DNA or RNA helicase
MKEYREFKKTLVSDIYDVEAVNAGVLTNKLMQFANGSMYNEQGEVIPVHKEKLDALDELIERADGDNVLIFYGFRFDLEEIRKRHPDAIVLNEAENAVSLWNEGKITKLLAHPASCAHGLNLQYGGHIAIWFGLTWSLELWLQANARLPRPGQTKIVSIYQILARGTVDERALSVLADKGTNQDRIIQAVLAEIDKG